MTKRYDRSRLCVSVQHVTPGMKWTLWRESSVQLDAKGQMVVMVWLRVVQEDPEEMG